MSNLKKQLYLIDVLNDPSHVFSEVIGDFFQTYSIHVPYTIVDGLSESVDYQAVLDAQPAGIILSGSLSSAYEDLPWIPKLEAFIRDAHALELPILGICFGHQILATALGGTVENLSLYEFGNHPVFLKETHPYLAGFDTGSTTLQVHQDHVTQLPPGAVSLGFSEKTEHQIFCIGNSFGIQFHPEYTLTMLNTIIQTRKDKLIAKGPFLSETHLVNLSKTWEQPKQAPIIIQNFIQSLNLN